VFDRRLDPPMTVGLFYFDPAREAVVFEVYDDVFREFLKQAPALAGKRFDWMLDVAADAPHDPRYAVVRPSPIPVATDHGSEDAPALTLEEAVAACAAADNYRVIRTSDPK
jgi:hypothetical protein